MKELWKIFAPRIKPYGEWDEEDKWVATLVVVAFALFYVGGVIANL